MDNNNPLQSNNIRDGFVDNGRFNSYSSNLPPTNVIPSSNLNTSYNFSAMGDISVTTSNYEQPMFSFMNNEYATTMQSYPINSSNSTYMPQHIVNHDVNSSLLNFPQANNPKIFRFEIPGFKIEIFVTPTNPTTTFSNLTNLNMQNQFQQQGHTFSNVFINNPQTQFQQQQ